MTLPAHAEQEIGRKRLTRLSWPAGARSEEAGFSISVARINSPIRGRDTWRTDIGLPSHLIVIVAARPQAARWSRGIARARTHGTLAKHKKPRSGQASPDLRIPGQSKEITSLSLFLSCSVHGVASRCGGGALGWARLQSQRAHSVVRAAKRDNVFGRDGYARFKAGQTIRGSGKGRYLVGRCARAKRSSSMGSDRDVNSSAMLLSCPAWYRPQPERALLAKPTLDSLPYQSNHMYILLFAQEQGAPQIGARGVPSRQSFALTPVLPPRQSPLKSSMTHSIGLFVFPLHLRGHQAIDQSTKPGSFHYTAPRQPR